MKFSIKKNIIFNQLVNVSKAISPKNIIPILNGIKFNLTDEGLTLVASNSDLTIESFIKKEDIESIDQTGEIIIQSKYILDIIKTMPADIINFEVFDGLKILIYSEKTQFDLNCLNSLDYPSFEIEETKNPIVIKASVLKKMIKQTIFAISTQESRPLLTGLNIKINGDVLECVATDSYRLAKKVIKLDQPYTESIDIVVPGRNISEFDHIIEDNDSNVEIHFVNNKLLFKYENILFLSNLLNGTYPNTSSFIPNEFKHVITVKLSDYFASIDRAALLANSKEKNIIKMEAKDDELCISSFSDEIGKVEDYIKVARNNNDELSISFSSKYMSDALKTFDDENIIINMNEDSKPIIIKSINDESLIQLILPIKTF